MPRAIFVLMYQRFGTAAAGAMAVAVVAIGACTPEAEPLAGGDAGSAEDAPSDSTADASTPEDASPKRPWGYGKTCEGCTTGQKRCGLRCVSLDDIRYGCADPSCGPVFTPFAASEIRCVGGKLTIRCVAGFKDCNDSVADGCEAQLDSPQTCGTCGNACAAGQVCDLGVCKTECSFPRTNCQLKIDDPSRKGACRDLSSSTLSCGACLGYCGHYATSCTNGACGPNACQPGTHLCDERYRCVDDEDPTFCSGCVPRELREGEVRAPCVGGAPAVACTTGYEICPQSCGVDPTGAPTCRGEGCTTTKTDRYNCGSCGNACTADQRCIDGACTDAPPAPLASGLDGVVGLALDAAAAYVSTATTISRVALADGAKTVLVSDPKRPRGLAVDATHLYWASELGGAILRVPLAGGSPEVMFAATMPSQVIVDESTVTFCDQNGVRRAPKTPGAKPVVLPTDGCERLAQSNNSIVVLNATGNVEIFEKSTNGLQERGSSYAAAVAVAEGGYYWVFRYRQQLALRFTDAASAAEQTASAYPSAAAPSDMTSDGCRVYFAVDGAIWRYRAGVDTSERVASGVARILRVDDKHVYWVAGDGSALFRALK